MKYWLDVITEATKFGESPERYYWWAGLATIAATMRKQVYLDRYYYKLYPNIYVMIVSARSGLRKGNPCSLIGKLLKKLNCTRVISGQSSIEGIIKELATQVTVDGQVFSEAQGIITSGELASAFVNDEYAWTYLTDLYNTHEHEDTWQKRLRNSEPEVLKAPCINFFAGSNERLFEDAIKGKDIEGGFIARTFIVHEYKRRTINPLVDAPEGMIPVDALVKHLEKIKDLKGEFHWTADAGSYYKEWYRDICEREFDDRTGTMERFGDSVLKVAMLLSLARLDDPTTLRITLEDLNEAIEKCEACIPGMNRVTLGTGGKSEISDAVSKVVKFISEQPEHRVARKKLMRKLWPDIDEMSLGRVVETLLVAGIIDEPRRENGDIVFKLADDKYQQIISYENQIKKRIN